MVNTGAKSDSEVSNDSAQAINSVAPRTVNNSTYGYAAYPPYYTHDPYTHIAYDEVTATYQEVSNYDLYSEIPVGINFNPQPVAYRRAPRTVSPARPEPLQETCILDDEENINAPPEVILTAPDEETSQEIISAAETISTIRNSTQYRLPTPSVEEPLQSPDTASNASQGDESISPVDFFEDETYENSVPATFDEVGKDEYRNRRDRFLGRMDSTPINNDNPAESFSSLVNDDDFDVPQPPNSPLTLPADENEAAESEVHASAIRKRSSTAEFDLKDVFSVLMNIEELGRQQEQMSPPSNISEDNDEYDNFFNEDYSSAAEQRHIHENSSPYDSMAASPNQINLCSTQLDYDGDEEEIISYNVPSSIHSLDPFFSVIDSDTMPEGFSPTRSDFLEMEEISASFTSLPSVPCTSSPNNLTKQESLPVVPSTSEIPEERRNSLNASFQQNSFSLFKSMKSSMTNKISSFFKGDEPHNEKFTLSSNPSLSNKSRSESSSSPNSRIQYVDIQHSLATTSSMASSAPPVNLSPFTDRPRTGKHISAEHSNESNDSSMGCKLRLSPAAELRDTHVVHQSSNNAISYQQTSLYDSSGQPSIFQTMPHSNGHPRVQFSESVCVQTNAEKSPIRESFLDISAPVVEDKLQDQISFSRSLPSPVIQSTFNSDFPSLSCNDELDIFQSSPVMASNQNNFFVSEPQTSCVTSSVMYTAMYGMESSEISQHNSEKSLEQQAITQDFKEFNALTCQPGLTFVSDSTHVSNIVSSISNVFNKLDSTSISMKSITTNSKENYNDVISTQNTSSRIRTFEKDQISYSKPINNYVNFSCTLESLTSTLAVNACTYSESRELISSEELKSVASSYPISCEYFPKTLSSCQTLLENKNGPTRPITEADLTLTSLSSSTQWCANISNPLPAMPLAGNSPQQLRINVRPSVLSPSLFLSRKNELRSVSPFVNDLLYTSPKLCLNLSQTVSREFDIAPVTSAVDINCGFVDWRPPSPYVVIPKTSAEIPTASVGSKPISSSTVVSHSDLPIFSSCNSVAGSTSENSSSKIRSSLSQASCSSVPIPQYNQKANLLSVNSLDSNTSSSFAHSFIPNTLLQPRPETGLITLQQANRCLAETAGTRASSPTLSFTSRRSACSTPSGGHQLSPPATPILNLMLSDKRGVEKLNDSELRTIHKEAINARLKEEKIRVHELQRLEQIESMCMSFKSPTPSLSFDERHHSTRKQSSLCSEGEKSSRSDKPLLDGDLYKKIDSPSISSAFKPYSTVSSGGTSAVRLWERMDAYQNERDVSKEKLTVLKARLQDVIVKHSNFISKYETEKSSLRTQYDVEIDAMNREKEALGHVQSRRVAMEVTTRQQREKDLQKINSQRERIEGLKRQHDMTGRQLEMCPEGQREQLLLLYKAEADQLEQELRIFEDLEFRHLEMETCLDDSADPILLQLKEQEVRIADQLTNRRLRIGMLEKDMRQLDKQMTVQKEQYQKSKQQLSLELQQEKITFHELSEQIMREKQATYDDIDFQVEPFPPLPSSPLVSPQSPLVASPPSLKPSLQRSESSASPQTRFSSPALQLHLNHNSKPPLIVRPLASPTNLSSPRSSCADEPSPDNARVELSSPTSSQPSLATSSDGIVSSSLTDDSLGSRLSPNNQIVCRHVEFQDSNDPVSRSPTTISEEESVMKRNHLSRQARPLTRYLPNPDSTFNLSAHLESQGHLVAASNEVICDAYSCKGSLLKRCSGRLGASWKRRWFVLDRQEHRLNYYTRANNELCPRGGVPTSSLLEVYPDHTRNFKSPNPELTFVIKSRERTFHLIAPSSATMRIWIDAVVTSCEGNDLYS